MAGEAARHTLTGRATSAHESTRLEAGPSRRETERGVGTRPQASRGTAETKEVDSSVELHRQTAPTPLQDAHCLGRPVSSSDLASHRQTSPTPRPRAPTDCHRQCTASRGHARLSASENESFESPAQQRRSPPKNQQQGAAEEPGCDAPVVGRGRSLAWEMKGSEGPTNLLKYGREGKERLSLTTGRALPLYSRTPWYARHPLAHPPPCAIAR